MKPNLPVIAADSWAIQAGSNETIFHFELSGEAFISLFDETAKKGGALKVNSLQCQAHAVGNLARQVIERMGAGAHKMTIKVVAPEPLLANVAKLLESAGFPADKTHAVAENTTVLFYGTSGRVRCALRQAAKVTPVIPSAPVGKPKKVLIIEDSPAVATILSRTFKSDPGLEVVAIATRPSQVEDLLIKHRPDVITLDIYLPEMDGISLLEQYLPRYPIPTIMVTSMRMEDGPFLLRALELGAIDYVQKPSLSELKEAGPKLIELVKQAANAKLIQKSQKRDSDAKAELGYQGSLSQDSVVAIGSSTGGTEAVKELLTRLPMGMPPIIIGQHIPAVFSKAFADRLNELCPSYEVSEARDGDILSPGRIFVCAGGKQTHLVKQDNHYVVRVADALPNARYTPGIDILFDSVAKVVGNKAIGVIMTGMGNDGAKGLLNMRNAGARTVGQDEASCIIFGMPKQAIKLGAVEEICRPEEMPQILLRWLREKKAA